MGNANTGSGGGIAFAPDGTLYQTSRIAPGGSFSLNRLNPANAARLSSVPLTSYFDGLGIRPTDGAMFASTGGTSEQVYTINPTTGAATLIGLTGVGSTSDMAFTLPISGLAPVVELYGPGGALLARATAGPDLNALLQTVATTVGGTYTIAVGGNGGAIGGYSVQIVLNAAIEEEGVLPVAGNGSRTSAQNLGDSFLDLNPLGGNADRGAVLGEIDAGTSSVELIANGGFETGDFSGWTVFTSSPTFGTWQINNGTLDPASPATPQPPISGNFDALTDATGGALRRLSQSFVVPANVTRATLKWSDRIQNFASIFQDPNQEFRVLITTSTGAVLQTVYSTNPGDPLIQLGPNHRSFDLTQVLQGQSGQNLQLRIEEQDNLFYFNVTVDNVSLSIETGASEPEHDYYAVELAAGQSVSLAMALPGFTPGATTFAADRTDIVTPGLPGQTGTIPLEVAYRDLNGDGKLDMVTANGGAASGPNAAGSIAIRFGNGDGTFGGPTLYPTGGLFTRFLDFGDTNGDGKLDIVASNDDSNSVSLLLGNGNGTFGNATTYPVGADPLGVTVADLNADGRADVVVPHFGGTIGVRLGQANGTLGNFTQFSVGASGPFSTAVGDVNSDGRPDVVTANFASGSMSVLLGNGGGAFSLGRVISGQGTSPWGIVLADLNGDGRLDVITGNQGSANIAVRLGTGNSLFFGSPAFFSTGGNGPRTVALGDVNGDGKLDVAVPNIGSTTAAVLIGNGNGAFSPPLTYSTGINPNYATLADLNGDGFDDLSTANAGSGGIGSVSMRLNTTPSVRFELQDASGNVVATATGAPTNFDSGLSYVPAAGGTYYVHVFGNASGSYDLVVMRGAAFDAEPNDGSASAQDITAVEGALGAVSEGGGSVLYATGGDGTRLIRINTATGLATDIGPFGTTQTWATAFTPDGTMWTIINGFSASGARLATVNLATGTATAVGSASNWTGTPVIALEADAAGNLLGASFSGTLFSVNKTTGLMSPIGPLGFTNIMDLAFDQAGLLWAVDGSNRLFRVNPATGQSTLQTTIGGVNGAVMGLMIDPADNAMYVTTYTTNSPLYRVNPLNGTVTQIGAGLGVPVPHGGDFRLLEDADVYEVALTAASKLQLATRTPADGPGEFVNGLDPRLELFGPDGALVAAGTILADGRNEGIEYQVPATGVYRVRVSGEDGTSGEYFLSRNVVPALADVAVTSPINEGDSATITGTVIDPDALDTHTILIDWGPGEGTTALELAAGVTTFTASHQYRDDRPSGTPADRYPVVVTLTDSHGASAQGTSTTFETTSDLVVNGGFETGNFTGWEITTTSGAWSINNGSLDPAGPGLPLPPITGNFDAVSVQTGGGLRILSEPIVVPADLTAATLSWSDRIRNHAAQFADPGQEFRVLILDAAGNTLQEVFSTDPGDPLQQIGPNLRSFDVTSLLQSRAGQPIRISFQQQDSLYFFNVTLDDVKLLVTTSEAVESPPLEVVVNNVAPDLGTVNLSASTIDEGQSVTVSGTFSDPALGVATESFTGSALWSDGVTTPLTIDNAAGTFTTTRSFPDDDPTGTPADTFTVTISIADDDGGSDSATSPLLTVRNVAPSSVSLSTSSPVNENDTLTLSGTFADSGVPDTFTVVIEWGPGETSTTLTLAAGVTSFTASHQYLDDNPTGTASDVYAIRVTITDDDGGGIAAQTEATVVNLAPELGVMASDATPSDLSEVGQTVSVSALFTDMGSLDSHAAQIDWGDGSSSAGSAQGGSASGSHAYAAGGIYMITLTLADDDTGADSATTMAYVTGVGVVRGQLQIIGSNADDLVIVNLADGNDQVFRVHASFLPPNPGYIDVPAAGITSILVMLFDGNDQAQLAGNLPLPAILDGGGGSDHLNAGGGAVLIGGLGDDFLQGGGGGAILIGGLGDDSLLGGSLEDILIGGTTSFDADQEALFALLTEWTSARDFQTRIANLRTGEGPILDGRKLEKGTTVFDDGDVDTLNGAADLDWFFYLLGEDVIKWSTKDSLN